MSQFRVTPTNIRNGNKAPYFVINAANKHEAETQAAIEFKEKSSLSRFPNWNIDIEKI